MHNTKRMTPPPSFSQVFAELQTERTMSPLIARRVFDSILAGGWTPVQIGAFLVSLELLGLTGTLLGVAAKAMRARMVEVKHNLPLVFDICGTGGDGKNSVNVSTGAAIIIAAAGVPVAKHGNRAATSRTGAADVLTALGIPIEMPPAAALEVLRTSNITFLFAQEYQPALKYAAGPRRELGVPTVFNLLGPLCNPAQATHQLIGTYSEELRPAWGPRAWEGPRRPASRRRRRQAVPLRQGPEGPPRAPWAREPGEGWASRRSSDRSLRRPGGGRASSGSSSGAREWRRSVPRASAGSPGRRRRRG